MGKGLVRVPCTMHKQDGRFLVVGGHFSDGLVVVLVDDNVNSCGGWETEVKSSGRPYNLYILQTEAHRLN